MEEIAWVFYDSFNPWSYTIFFGCIIRMTKEDLIRKLIEMNFDYFVVVGVNHKPGEEMHGSMFSNVHADDAYEILQNMLETQMDGGNGYIN